VKNSLHKKNLPSRLEDLRRIAKALDAAAALLLELRSNPATPEFKSGGDPVTAADLATNELLFRTLPSDGDGWLSEESKDDSSRLDRHRVWIVDPLDGTKEFIAGIPEWCVSVGLIEDGRAVAGGVSNPATGEVFLGSLETGFYVSAPRGPKQFHSQRDRALVLASRSEVQRGRWTHLENAPFSVEPVGSIAYRLARVAAGFADATWTLDLRHEWDVAAGAALVLAAHGDVRTLDGCPLEFNRPIPRVEGLVAFSPACQIGFENFPSELRRCADPAKGRRVGHRMETLTPASTIRDSRPDDQGIRALFEGGLR
jgi:myo-inositol-1(or 4)-monophosphatase